MRRATRSRPKWPTGDCWKSQPRFAETHFRLARLLEQAGNWDEAFRHYVAARDLDGLPMRLPSDFQQCYRDVAARHPHAILIDGPAELHARADHGIIDDVFFADGFHPSLNGYTVLAQAILRKLRQRQIFGWSAEAPFPVVTPLDCANGSRWTNRSGELSAAIPPGSTTEWHTSGTIPPSGSPRERNTARPARTEGWAHLDSIRIPGVGPRPEPFREEANQTVSAQPA